MRKYHHTSCGGLILAAVLAAGAACADVWPSWLSPASGSYDRGNQALSGAVERLTVVYGPDYFTNYVTTNIWKDYFAQWQKCDAAKKILKASIDSGRWIYVDYADLPTNATMTATGLLQRVSAPTNWFDKTPRFNLAMEINGWVLFPAIMTNIVWMTGPSPSGAVTNGMRYYAFGTSNTYDNAVADALGKWSTTQGPGSSTLKSYVILATVGEDKTAALNRYDGGLYVSGFSTPHNTNFSAYVWIYNYVSEYSGGGVSVYSAQDDDVPSSPGYRYLGEWTNAPGSLRSQAFYLNLIGPTSAPSYYEYPASTNEVRNTGWEIRANIVAPPPRPFRTIHRYNEHTNGFKWFR